MKKKIIFCLTFLIIWDSFYSQTLFDTYSLLECKGEIPLSFIGSTQGRYKINKESIEEKNKSIKKDKEDFYLISSYNLNYLLTSGSVLFGDTLTNYVNQVARNLLVKSDKKELLNKLEFYVLKSNQVNAFATQEGIIFITIGLLARIENEAQLTFVLAHEISHFEENHVIDSYIKNQDYIRAYKRNQKSLEDVISNLSSYSKEQEFKADSLGYSAFKKLGYNKNDAIKVLEVLKKSELPIEDFIFDESFFNKDYYKVPLDKFDPFINLSIVIDEKNDSLSSHPQVSKRINKINSFDTIETSLEYSKNENYSEIRDIARFENLNLELLSGNYVITIYEGYTLLSRYPENSYLKAMIAKGLYGYSKVFAKSEYRNKGQINKLSQFLLSLTNNEIKLLMLKYSYNTYNDELYDYIVDVCNDLHKSYDFNFEMLYTEFPNDSLYKKEDYYKYGFINELKEDKFIDLLKMVSTEENLGIKLNNASVKNFKKDKYLGVDKLLVLSPTYSFEDNINGKKYIRSEERQKKYVEQIEHAANKLNISYEMFAKEKYTQESVEKFNEEVIIKEWLMEYENIENHKMIPFTKYRLEKIIEKYNCNYIYISGIDSYKYKTKVQFVEFLSLAAWPFAPYTIYTMVSPEFVNVYYNLVLNMDSYNIDFFQIDKTKSKESSINTRSFLYYALYQISH